MWGLETDELNTLAYVSVPCYTQILLIGYLTTYSKSWVLEER